MRKSILAAATALTAIATGLVVTGAVTARPATAALSDVPADCFASATAYRSDGQRLSYGYADRKTSTEAISGDKLGWVPTAVVTFSESGGEDVYAASSLATHPTDGNIYYFKRVVRRIDGVWKVTELTITRVASGFADTRLLTFGGPYVYRVAGSSLYRYKFAFSNGQPTMSAPTRLTASGWAGVRTLVYERSGGTGSAAVDVLLGTKASGELKEWRINYATPATITSKVLHESAWWASLTSLNTGFCNSRPNGRPLLGINATGGASVHFDANKTDGVGTDIKGGSLGSPGWTAKAYNQ